MKKLLAVGVIVLFLGVSVIPSTATTDVKQIVMPTSNGNTLYVGGSGPNNYTKIQDAVDDSSDGDTIYVYDDSSPYTGKIHVEKSINIIGENKHTTVVFHDDYCCFALNVDRVNISGFTLKDTGYCDYGIRVWETSNHTIIDNIIIGMDLGVYLMHSNNNYIMNNEMKDGGTGVVVGYDSSFNNISDNDFFNNSCGVSLTSGSKNNTISNNYLTGCGFSVGSDSYQNTFFGNSINNKPFLFLVNEQDLVFDGIDVGEIILINCNNITIQNLEVSDTTYGMKLIYTDDCVITNNTFQLNKYTGITLGSCNNNTITDNYIYSNSWNGVSLNSNYPSRCSYNNISGNNIIDNRVNGVYISESTNNIISGNTIQGNGFQPSYYLFGSGVLLEFDADNNNSENGIHLDKSGFNSIKFNNIISNKKDVSFFKYLFLRNHWKRNYWDTWKGFGPKIIWGQRMIITGWDYWGQPEYSPIPWVIFDWRPAQEPYDIEVT